MGDQYTFVALASATRAIIGYRTGKRDGATSMQRGCHPAHRLFLFARLNVPFDGTS
jgi:hypothetical protein